MMFSIDHSQKRVEAVIESINQLKQSEFPYPHPRDALDLLEKRFEKHQYRLETTEGKSPASIKVSCSSSLYELYVYVPILGFILRSTNTRNAFEAYGPLLRLAKSILGDSTKLIISSEWEYSPFVYRAIEGLSGFVLIGLPATESANPLLIPLAGHELGHSIWLTNQLETKLEKEIEKSILDEITNKQWNEFSLLYPQFKKEDIIEANKDLYTRDTWVRAYAWTYALTLLQIEEIFCDFFGLQLFAESYLHAFTYLLLPGVSGERPLSYPRLKDRVNYLERAAKSMDVIIPDGFNSAIVDEKEPELPTEKLRASVADAAASSLISELIKQVQDIVADKGVPKRDPSNVDNIYETFYKRIAPTSKAHSLTDIVNAGWNCILKRDLWEDVYQIKTEDRRRVLKDLMLKSMEVSEIYERIGKQ